MQDNHKFLFKNIDDTILSIINNAYFEALNDGQFVALKTYYKNKPFQTSYTSTLVLTDYLYLKAKSYALEHLLTYLLLYKSQLINDYNTSPLNQIITPLIFALNNEYYDTSKSVDLNLKGTNLTKKRNNLVNQTTDVINSFKNLKNFNALDRSSPYLFYKSIFSYKLNYDFFQKDFVFYTAFFNSNSLLLPNNFIKYITLLIHLIYTNTKGNIENSNNLIKSSNTILAYLKKDKSFYEYKKIEELIKNMDNDLTDIITIYNTMDNTNTSEKYCFHHLINRYYHNNFFSSLNHHLLSVIFKRIDIKELYGTIIQDNSSYLTPLEERNIISESKQIIDNYSIKDSAFHLRLLELLIKFDIDLYQITFDDLYELKIEDDEFKSNRYNFLKEEKLIFDTTINFIYIFLENYENNIFNIITSCISDIENKTNNEIKESHTVYFLEKIINQINNELDNIYTKIPDDLDFKKIDYKTNYNDLYEIIRKHSFLLTYLIKQGFIIG